MRLVLAIVCLFAFSALQAQDFYQDDINAMVSAKFNFDGAKKSSRDDSFKLGFSVNHSYLPVHRTGGMNLNLTGNNSIRQSLVDVEISSRTRYFSTFRLGGVDMLTYRTTTNWLGENIKWPMGLNTDQVVGVAIIAAALGYYAYDSGSK